MLSLANHWQRSFPLTPRPFAEIAALAGLSEADTISRFAELQRQGIVDRIGPVFRPNTVGASSLAAMAVPPGRLAAVAELVSAEPGVNHNYHRDHQYNLWFVVTAATPDEVERTLARIETEAGLKVLRLPLVEEFHIDLGFDLESGVAPRAASRTAFPPLSPVEEKLVAATARGLPLVAIPYAAVAMQLGCTEREVIERLGTMLADGRIRRIGAVIRHRRLGYTANAMAVWDIPDDAVAPLARAVANDPAVTLCYRRARSLPEWPYNLYCMVHGRQRSRVLYEVKRISVVHGLARYPRTVLFSERCFSQKAAAYG
jgi:DNA-binding Lrp family transcriptional regulator